jgi:hypothetical protein
MNDFLRARQYGRETWALTYALAKASHALARFVEGLRYANSAIETAPDDPRKADAYAIRALIYEDTNPPLRDDAIFTWGLLLSLPGAKPETRALAEAHLLELTGEGPARTPTPTGTAAPAASPTPEGPPSPTATLAPPPPVPSPTATPLPTPTEDPYEHDPI